MKFPVLKIRTNEIGLLTECSLDGMPLKPMTKVTVRAGLQTHRITVATIELYVSLDLEGAVKAEIKGLTGDAQPAVEV